jgi:hypothetical protein
MDPHLLSIPPPSLDLIREAMQRPKEPERRLIDEFFWFWPAVFGDSKSDPAIQAMAHGKWSAAYDIWISKEQDPSQGHIATHNIAIIFHIIAIDWTLYHLAADVDPAKEAKIASYWREAFARWRSLLQINKFGTRSGRVFARSTILDLRRVLRAGYAPSSRRRSIRLTRRPH